MDIEYVGNWPSGCDVNGKCEQILRLFSIASTNSARICRFGNEAANAPLAGEGILGHAYFLWSDYLVKSTLNRIAVNLVCCATRSLYSMRPKKFVVFERNY